MIDEYIKVLRQDFQEESKNDGEGNEKEGDGTQIRTYINNVTIKALTSDITNVQKQDSKNEEYIEQKFRVTKDTTWNDMLTEAMEFWGLSQSEQKFTLVLPNQHDIMSLNREETHFAHTLAKYFEIHRAKRAVLILKKPDTERKQLAIEEKMMTKVRNAVKTKRFHKEDTRTPEERDRDQKRENLEKFLEKYPGLEDELITDMEQFNPNRENKTTDLINNPDTSFCNFFISLCMFMLSLVTFYSHRDFNNEFFNRQMIDSKLNHNPLGFTDYNDIKSVEDFKFFMNETMAFQIFEPQQARLKAGDVGYISDYKSPYIF